MPEKKILLVDDDPVCLSLMRELLEDKYVLKLARNGKEALDTAGGFNPDLIVLDVMMSGIDGFEVCRSLRNSDRSEKAKIIFVSAKEPGIENQIDINSNGYGFLLKPFGPDDFDNKVERILAA
ncbi:MAG: response regulator [Deltaproteobacteria bacterium]|jgi:CheY-like chemotaxis protein|nr:response regulator [Deltaproteobacteria bacterium]MBT4089086.1 response regulator [Deltaproteobacteria bacterium]MBT4266934.1 response regulator [Deltaproteobacteria bacterium]MBT4637452.1 response regulator [Deltaproteobacteria bacterium]MBT6502801.1 response regulator [Deltaproteobacteria bacterium]